MASCRLSRSLCLLLTVLPGLLSQSTSIGPNAYDSLIGLECSQFKGIIEAAGRQLRYQSSTPLTLFVFNDTAYNRLPPYMLNTLYDRESPNNAGADEFVSSFTMKGVMETSSFSDAQPYSTMSVKSRKLFLNKRNLRIGNVASGRPGPTKYFVNGGIIIRPNIQAGQHVIHIVDRVLPLTLTDNALAYASGYNPDALVYKFYELFMKKMSVSRQEDPINNYDTQVHSVLSNLNDPVTFFLPSDQAINSISLSARGELLGDSAKLLRIITLHIIPKKAVYTSLVNHNEQFNTQYNSGRVVFRKNFDREAVYVTGALQGGGTVTARISPADITVLNGVVHHIDQVLGFVYKTVLDEISSDATTQNFMELTNRARADLRNALIRSSGVYVFVPTNDAMQAIGYRYENYTNNQSLINMVVEMSLIQTYQNVLLTDYSGNYESFRTVRSRFNDQLVKIYTVGDDTWVEGGYVKARVVKPNIGCTNGIVHHIDAVFGVPTRDMPYTIYCEDWLVSTIIQLQFVGLASYMRDPTLQGNRRCENSASARSGVSDKFDVTDGDTDLCGDTEHRCEFTFFVPNGTAIDNFGRTTHGRAIMENRGRWRWVLQRLLTFREVIYLDGLAPGQQRVMYSDNGDEVIITTDERGNNSSGHTSDITNATYVLFEGVRAKVIHSDIGATNGVIHIIDSVLFVNDDLTRSAGSVSSQATSLLVLLLLTFSQAVWWMGGKLDGRWN